VGTFHFFLQCSGLKSPERKLGAIAPQGRRGFNEQIFGAGKQIPGPGLSDKERFGPESAERKGRILPPIRSANLPRPSTRLGPFPIYGSDEQIFGADEQVSAGLVQKNALWTVELCKSDAGGGCGSRLVATTEDRLNISPTS